MKLTRAHPNSSDLSHAPGRKSIVSAVIKSFYVLTSLLGLPHFLPFRLVHSSSSHSWPTFSCDCLTLVRTFGPLIYPVLCSMYVYICFCLLILTTPAAMFRSNKRHKPSNIEYHSPLDAQQSRVHSDYGSNRGVRHQMIAVDITGDSNPTLTSVDSSDWSRARYDAPAFVEADVELEEMEDCELEALGLSRYLQRAKVPESADIPERMTQSVRVRLLMLTCTDI